MYDGRDEISRGSSASILFVSCRSCQSMHDWHIFSRYFANIHVLWRVDEFSRYLDGLDEAGAECPLT